MKKLLLAAAAGAALVGAAGAANAGLLYQLDVTATYTDTPPANSQGPFQPSPDTSYLTFTNSGPSTFTGTISDVAVSNFGGDFSLSFGGLTLNPGDTFTFATSPESSNQGGFNGPFGSPQPGIIINVVGMFGSTAVSLQTDDADMHSGVPATNPFGVTLDNYVLQGGDPLGRDTGDGFEESQADSHFTFSASSQGVPEPASWALMILGFGAAGAALRRRRAFA